VEAVNPPVPRILEIADEEDLHRAEDRQGERPQHVSPGAPPADQRGDEGEDLERVDDEATHVLVGIERSP
jgi:hypothetical protein